MTDTNLVELIAELEPKVAGATPSTRDAVLKELNKSADKFREAGKPVPQRLKELEYALVDDAVEDQFDNLPV